MPTCKGGKHGGNEQFLIFWLLLIFNIFFQAAIAQLVLSLGTGF
ncbi:hypothetical protein [Nostoc sp. MS1]|nr:hypothetical protein [Nostoc sp. MS1]